MLRGPSLSLGRRFLSLRQAPFEHFVQRLAFLLDRLLIFLLPLHSEVLVGQLAVHPLHKPVGSGAEDLRRAALNLLELQEQVVGIVLRAGQGARSTYARCR